MNNDLLLVIDVQNDFIDGALGSPEAQKIVEPLFNAIRDFNGKYIVFTRDTHDEDYLNTNEGKKLPIKHCIRNTVGWDIQYDICSEAFHKPDIEAHIYNKGIFAEPAILKTVECYKADNIYLCGLCTDICVISNALCLKALYPEKEIYVIANLCAGTTPEKHDAALKVLESCQVNVINY